jgi:PDZ domain-containing protein
VRDAEGIVKVAAARSYSSEGALYMTTVAVDLSVTGAEVLLAAVDPSKTVVYRNDLTGGQSLEHLEQLQRAAMRVSQRRAREVALNALGLREGDGARVIGTSEGSPAEDVLRPGDVIVSLNDHAVETSCDVAEEVTSTSVGDEIEIEVERDGRIRTFDLRTARSEFNPRASMIGVSLEDVDSGVHVDFETGRIAGPSAGLMLSLALYDRLTPEDLTDGRRIAGTGTIGCGGRVGPIGGVAQKVVAAERLGADVFLAPAANSEDARAASDAMKVVSVSSFDDALSYLESAS